MLKQVGDGNLALPESLTIPASSAASTLSLELGYMFLPGAWGKGYAAEALTAVFHACKKVERKYWGAWEKVYVRAIVNDGNPASLRVMEKAGVKEKGVFEWKGKPVFLNGTWESESRLHIFGFYLVE
jgi:RimJ/RimL family protein N-acetyltransferase